MIGVEDLPEIESKIRTALRRAGVKRRVVEARMQRIVQAASTIMDPRMSLLKVTATVTVAELYAALLMLAVADTFRDGEQPGIVGDFARARTTRRDAFFQFRSRARRIACPAISPTVSPFHVLDRPLDRKVKSSTRFESSNLLK